MRSLRLTLALGAVALVAVGVAVVAALAARAFYVRAKVATVEPVRLQVYAEANRRLQREAANAADRPRRIVLIGDSRIQQWRFDAPPGWEVVNRGLGGETSAQLVFRLAQDALALDPDVVVVQSGINDLVAASLVSGQLDDFGRRTEENLRSIAETSARAGARVVLLTIVPPARPSLLRRVVWNDAIRDEVMRLNRSLLAGVMPGNIRILDTASVLGAEGGRLERGLAVDALHLNDEAYRRLSQAVLAVLPADSAVPAPPES